MTTSASNRLKELAARVESALDGYLPPASESPRALHEAMRYSVFAGGKRVRPALCLLVSRAEALHRGESAEVAEARALAPAAALEMLHTYSLIHDDLPCMDDDDLRRGRPTCHRAFSEAIAVLAGDALNTLAFETIVEGAGDRAGELVHLLASSSGTRGMVGGQVDDLKAVEAGGDARLLESIHMRKTARLFAASCGLGAIAASCEAQRRDGWIEVGLAIGLAFQIVDDILDVTATSDQMGKRTGKDARAGKLTYPAIFGLDEARRHAARSLESARQLLARCGDPEGEISGFLGLLAARTS